jgi:Holliday junction resolvase
VSGGKRPRQKGDRFERHLVRFFQEHGFSSERVPLSGSAGGSYRGDLTTALLGRDLCIEAKHRADGFKELYSWIQGRDALIVKRDRAEPLVIVPLRLALEIAKAAERGK